VTRAGWSVSYLPHAGALTRLPQPERVSCAFATSRGFGRQIPDETHTPFCTHGEGFFSPSFRKRMDEPESTLGPTDLLVVDWPDAEIGKMTGMSGKRCAGTVVDGDRRMACF
jgi:hypothetical protein